MNKKTQKKAERRNKIKQRIRATVQGTADRPRLSIFKSSKYVYMQLIDDLNGNTLVASKAKSGIESAKDAGKELAELASDKGIKKVVFDRNGYKYHGIVKSAAEAARNGGLDF